MPNVMINNSHCPIYTENLRTIGELIPKLKDEYLAKGQFLTQILIDDKTMSPGMDKSLMSFEISECKSINFKTQNKSSIAQDTLDYLPDFIDSLTVDVRSCLAQGSIAESSLYKVIEKLDIFIQLMTHIHQTLNVDSNSKLEIGLTIKELEVHLLFIVKAINSAYKKEDTIILEDLLEHELIDNLTQWKIQALPKIKKSNSL